MPLTRLVFEEGVELVADAAGWRAVGSIQRVIYPSREVAESALLPRRPVLGSQRKQNLAPLTLLLRSATKEYYSSALSSVINAPLKVDFLGLIFDIVYLLGAVQYHCVRLAEAYAGMVNEFAQMTRIGGFTDAANFGGQMALYYEFEALLGATRRCYDSTRCVVWRKFGSRGTMPRSLEALLRHGKNSLPKELFELLSTSWEKHGVVLKAYRDCIHHYVPLSDAMATASMSKLPSGIWTARLRIPDNPEARSRSSFTFAMNLDALTFGWSLADEILTVVQAVVAEVKSPSNG